MTGFQAKHMIKAMSSETTTLLVIFCRKPCSYTNVHQCRWKKLERRWCLVRIWITSMHFRLNRVVINLQMNTRAHAGLQPLRQLWNKFRGFIPCQLSILIITASIFLVSSHSPKLQFITSNWTITSILFDRQIRLFSQRYYNYQLTFSPAPNNIMYYG